MENESVSIDHLSFLICHLLPEKYYAPRYSHSKCAVLVGARRDLAEPLLIYARGDKRADHAAIVSRFSVIQNIQPEVVPVLICVPPQVAEILHQHKGRVLLSL